ncbi:unnamed protein product [Prunus armeniaca]|uniref:DUF4283 domain-containing protein n=1 Tax=Prunus armeniaca TaxID=36596 RepID=A0A6J5XCB7_PRUAR|nr:unnamed protein product [Prunus armeniaca]
MRFTYSFAASLGDALHSHIRGGDTPGVHALVGADSGDKCSLPVHVRSAGSLNQFPHAYGGDISSAFSHRFVLTDVEQQEIVIESKENIGVKTDKFLPGGCSASDKPVNKEALRKTFYAIWKPKAHVTIVELEQNRFFFAFNTNLERATILNGGPGLFNGYLLILAEANEKVTRPGFLLAMGQMIGTALGGYVVTDQSKKVDCLGSYLRIRARIDVTNLSGEV